MSLTPILLQFSFSKERNVPANLRALEPEANLDSLMRQRGQDTGVAIIEKDHQRLVQLDGFGDELMVEGYQLVSASSQTRQHKVRKGEQYHMVRLLYLDETIATINPAFDTAAAQAGLKSLGDLAFWRVRAYRNPTERGDLISINFEVREQRYLQDDPTQPRLVRVRDGEGKQIGSPNPIFADAQLRITGDTPFLSYDI